MKHSEPQEEITARDMERIYPPILLSFGIPGNVLSLVILIRLRRRQSSLYLAFLAGVNLFVICVSLLLKWIGNLTETDFRNDSDVACKTHVFAVYSSLQISSWTLVFITSERACSVLYPHRVRTLCTKTRTLIALVTMTMCIFGLNSHFLIGYHLEFRPHINRTVCICKEHFEHFEFKVWPWIDFLFVFMIPCLFLVLGNVLILHKLRINQKFNANSIRQKDAIKARTNTVSFLTKMTISLNTVFIICVSPVSIISIGQPYWWPPETLTEQGLANLTLIWTSVTMVMYINSCATFLLYIMLGSKFRKELQIIFTSKCFRKRIFSLGRFSLHLSTTRSSVIQTIALGSISEMQLRKKHNKQLV